MRRWSLWSELLFEEASPSFLLPKGQPVTRGHWAQHCLKAGTVSLGLDGDRLTQ